MNFSQTFIRRPIATALLMVGLLLCGLAAYRLLPGSGWVRGQYSVMTLRRSSRDCWVIANFGAWPVGDGVGAPLLTRVCTVADTHGYTLRLVAHNSELGDKVYKPAGFAVTGTRRGQRVVMERIPKLTPNCP